VRSNTGSALEARVAQAATAALAEKQFVSSIDVLERIGWLPQSVLDDWRHGRLPFLEAGVQTNPSKVEAALRAFRAWAVAQGLRPSEAAYVARSVEREPLRFSMSGDEAFERAYRTHWISPALSERTRARLEAKASAPPELVAIEAQREWKCHRCAATGSWLVMERDGPACLACLGMGDLVLLPSGDAAVTRRARSASARSLVVVRWNRSRKRYQRVGLLVEPDALPAT
jgi:hypothetical protein